MRVIRPSATITLTARVELAGEIDPASGRAVQPDRAEHRIRHDRLEAQEEGRHPVAAHHRTPDSGHLAATVGDQHDVGCEHVEQHLEIPGPHRRQEPLDHLLLLGTIDLNPRPPRGDVLRAR